MAVVVVAVVVVVVILLIQLCIWHVLEFGSGHFLHSATTHGGSHPGRGEGGGSSHWQTVSGSQGHQSTRQTVPLPQSVGGSETGGRGRDGGLLRWQEQQGRLLRAWWLWGVGLPWTHPGFGRILGAGRRRRRRRTVFVDRRGGKGRSCTYLAAARLVAGTAAQRSFLQSPNLEGGRSTHKTFPGGGSPSSGWWRRCRLGRRRRGRGRPSWRETGDKEGELDWGELFYSGRHVLRYRRKQFFPVSPGLIFRACKAR